MEQRQLVFPVIELFPQTEKLDQPSSILRPLICEKNEELNQMEIPPQSFVDLIADLTQFAELTRFKDSSESTLTERNIIAAKEIITEKAIDLDTFLNAIDLSKNRIIERFGQSFMTHKSSVSRFPAITGGEPEVIHNFMDDILNRLLPKMIPDYHDKFRVLSEKSIPAVGKSIRDIPDFSLIDAHRDIELDSFLPFTFLDCLLPVVCEIPGSETAPTKETDIGVLQGMHYLAERIKYQIEVERSYSVSTSGFAVGTDGFTLKASFLYIDENQMNNFTFGCLQLFPKNKSWDTAELKDLPGLILLIAILTLDKKKLGWREPKQWVEETGITIKEVLGTGSFATVFLGNFQSRNEYISIKFPKFISRHSLNVDIQQFRNECSVLQEFLTKEVDSPNCCKLRGYDFSKPALFISPVGLSMVNFVADVARDQFVRFFYMKRLIVSLTSACEEVFQKTGITHRDIRPHNIVMKRTDTEDYEPVLIDWGMAGKGDQPYSFDRKNLKFQHDDIVTLFDQSYGRELKNAFRKLSLGEKDESESERNIYEVNFFPEFDRASIRYSAIAIYANNPNLAPPWESVFSVETRHIICDKLWN
jgi:tRNA A-37 threonylcarbamoyl transferase component Bud32